MMRLNSVARPAKLSVLMALGSGLLSVFLIGCPGNLDPALAGGPGGSGGGAGGAGDPTVCANAIFSSTCATGPCHSAGLHSAGLDLTPPVPASRVLDVAPDSTSGCNNMGKVFLQSGISPATGLILDNLQTTVACGAPMPFGTAQLSQTDIACLQQWANSIITGASGQ